MMEAADLKDTETLANPRPFVAVCSIQYTYLLTIDDYHLVNGSVDGFPWPV